MNEGLVFGAVRDMARALDEQCRDTPLIEMAAGLVATMGDHPPEKLLEMMSVAHAAALRIIGIAERNTPTEEGGKE